MEVEKSGGVVYCTLIRLGQCFSIKLVFSCRFFILRFIRMLSRLETLLDNLKRSSPCAPLILNNLCLTGIPDIVWKDEFCCEHLKEIFLKDNSISTLVGC